MISCLARSMLVAVVTALALCGAATAQTVLLEEVRTLSGGAAPVEHAFAITQPGAYQVTLTDLKLPAALTSARLAVTRGTTVLGTVGTTPSQATASFNFDATAGDYVVRVVGKPAASGAGAVGVKVTRAGETAAFNEFVATIAAPPPQVPENRAILDANFTPTVSGSYEIVLADLNLPEALSDLLASVTEVGGPQLAILPTAGTATFNAVAGVEYKVVAIAESPLATNAGLFSVRVRQVGASTNVFARTVPVGRVEQIGTVVLGAGAHVLALTDLQFPVALARKGAALTKDGALAAQTAGTGDTAFTPVPGDHSVYVIADAAVGSTGSYGLEVRPNPGAAVFSTVKTVGGAAGTTPAYNFVVDIATAGDYRVRVADFGFPSRFTALQLGASQGGSLLGTLTTEGSLNLTSVAAGRLFVVVVGAPGTASGGVLGLDVTPAAGGSPVFEVTQGVGNLFQARKVTVPAAGAYRVTLTDLAFPDTFNDLGAVVTRGAEAVGTILNSAQFDFTATPGNYFVNFIAIADPVENAGTYGVRVADKPASPTVTFTASASQVTVGTGVDLTWSSTNATSCLPDGWSTSRATSGTTRTAALTAATTFKIDCTGDGGTTSATVTVNTVSQSNSGGGGGGGAFGWLGLVGLALGAAVRAGRRAASHAG